MAKFRHDCDACTFLATFGGKDFYACKDMGAPSAELIIRFGNEGPDYSSIHSSFVSGPAFSGTFLSQKYGLVLELARTADIVP